MEDKNTDQRSNDEFDINLNPDDRFKDAPKHLLPLLNIKQSFIDLFYTKKKQFNEFLNERDEQITNQKEF